MIFKLGAELAKYETWEQMKTAEISFSGHFPKGPHRYGQLWDKGVGRILMEQKKRLFGMLTMVCEASKTF